MRYAFCFTDDWQQQFMVESDSGAVATDDGR